MRNLLFILFLLPTFALVSVAQGSEDRMKRSKVDVERLLNSSAWGKTQTDTDTTEMFYSPTRQGTSAIGKSSATRLTENSQQQTNNNRTDRGATNEAISVNYHIRLLSARPIREAISQMAILENAQLSKDLVISMQALIDRDYSKWIVISVTVDSNDGRYSGPAMQAFASATGDTLRNTTYLERKDGKKIYLLDYRAPTSDGLGAKFVFERTPDGKPFITESGGNFRFFSGVSDKIKLNVKYSIHELVYNGKLEL